MRGRILGLDRETGLAQVAGDDGRRYAFARDEWKPAGAPAVGLEVDFQPRDEQAVSVYGVQSAVSMAGSGAPVSDDRSRLVAALLAFFLGVFGVHKFYMGKTGAGVIMLLCTIPGALLLGIPTAICALIAFVEFILYLVMSDADFERRYIQGDKSWF